MGFYSNPNPSIVVERAKFIFYFLGPKGKEKGCQVCAVSRPHVQRLASRLPGWDFGYVDLNVDQAERPVPFVPAFEVQLPGNKSYFIDAKSLAEKFELPPDEQGIETWMISVLREYQRGR